MDERNETLKKPIVQYFTLQGLLNDFTPLRLKNIFGHFVFQNVRSHMRGLSVINTWFEPHPARIHALKRRSAAYCGSFFFCSSKNFF